MVSLVQSVFNHSYCHWLYLLNQWNIRDVCQEKRKGNIQYRVRFIMDPMFSSSFPRSLCLFFIGRKVLIFSILLSFHILALLGYLSAKMRWKNWLTSHIGGILGSYIGIVTATIVVNVPKVPVLNELPVLIFWFLPTIIGTPFIYKMGEKYKTKQGKYTRTL